MITISDLMAALCIVAGLRVCYNWLKMSIH